MSSLIPILLAIFSFSAVAKVPEAFIEIDAKKTKKIGRSACESGAMAKIVLPTDITDEDAKFRAIKTNNKDGKGSCHKEFKAGSTVIEFEIPDLEIEQIKLLDSGICNDNKARKGGYLLCIYSEDKDELKAEASYSYDTTAAKLEEPTDIVAANGEVKFKVILSHAPSGTQIEICYGEGSAADIEADTNCTSRPFKKVKRLPPNISINGLKDRVKHAFKIRIDQPNAKWGKAFERTPVPTAYPLDAYNGGGGDFAFSCQQTGEGGLVSLVFALLMLFILKIRRSAIITILLLLAPISHADFGQVNIALLGSPYRPDLDSEKTAQGALIFPFYKCFFRSNAKNSESPVLPLLGAEMDLHLWDGFGSLQLGLGMGYSWATGWSVEKDINGRLDCSKRREDDRVSLHMYQLRPQLTYIFSPFLEYFPLAPYVRAAVIGHGYSFFTGDKQASISKIKPHGFRFGYQAAVGMMLMLDFIEPSSVRSQGFFNHVFLKGELSYTKIDLFHKPGLQFSAKDIMGTELPLLWTFGLVFELP